MKRILFFTILAVFIATAGCRKTPDDPYEAFKDDSTPRWENGSRFAAPT